jgi:hypothetical protein
LRFSGLPARQASGSVLTVAVDIAMGRHEGLGLALAAEAIAAPKGKVDV